MTRSKNEMNRWWVVAIMFAVISGIVGLVNVAGAAEGLTSFDGVQLVANASNDGDSFLVLMDAKEHRLRLYFVDCPETSADTNSDAQRLREQARYFGLDDPKLVLKHGREAQRFVEQQLAKPFKVDTSFATAGGRSAGGRVYAFVTTADGHDLARLLVEKGLARGHGVARERPDGTHREKYFALLHDLESAAMMKRIGIWADSNPDKIAEMRASERKNEEELEEVKALAKGQGASGQLIDINQASQEELESLPGIGPVLAERIIKARPFKSVDELERVTGIGPKTMEKLRGRVAVGQVDPPPDSPKP